MFAFMVTAALPVRLHGQGAQRDGERQGACEQRFCPRYRRARRLVLKMGESRCTELQAASTGQKISFFWN